VIGVVERRGGLALQAVKKILRIQEKKNGDVFKGHCKNLKIRKRRRVSGDTAHGGGGRSHCEGSSHVRGKETPFPTFERLSLKGKKTHPP